MVVYKNVKGESVNEKSSWRIYGEDGVQLDRRKAKDEVKDYFSGIHRTCCKDIHRIWNADNKKGFIKEYKTGKEDIEMNQALRLGSEESRRVRGEVCRQVLSGSEGTHGNG